MYQFILGNGVQPPFMLCKSHPNETILISSSSIQSYKDVLFHVTCQEMAEVDLEVLEAFSDPPPQKVCYC